MNAQFLREEYARRINRAVDYIQANLGGNLTLEAIAEEANFSRYHFHRLFSQQMGETLGRFIQRLRVEKAAVRLTGNPRDSITTIALECGFSSSAVFSRSFREYFGVSPSQWRSKGCKAGSNMGKPDRKQREASDPDSTYPSDYQYDYRRLLEMAKKLHAKIEVRNLEAMNVAYIRHVGPYAGDEALFGKLFGKLCKWGGARDLFGPDTRMLSMYHDSPDITPEDKLRMDVGMTVPEGTEGDGEVNITTVPAGKYAVCHVEIHADQYPEAWAALSMDWLPESGYQPADGACFELYLNDPDKHPDKLHSVDICMPVKPL